MDKIELESLLATVPTEGEGLLAYSGRVAEQIAHLESREESRETTLGDALSRLEALEGVEAQRLEELDRMRGQIALQNRRSNEFDERVDDLSRRLKALDPFALARREPLDALGQLRDALARIEALDQRLSMLDSASSREVSSLDHRIVALEEALPGEEPAP